ncbi:glycosyltransferase [Celeribacter sp. ULVN23_4]
MVQALIASWGQMDLPENCQIRCLIVENDDQPHTRSIVAARPTLQNGLTLDYALETEIGIPFARNRAAQNALSHGDDLLVFVDDDETVTRDWLVRLIEGYRQSEAVLLGAPVRTSPPPEALSAFQSLMYENLFLAQQKLEQRTAETATLNTPGRAVIGTGNWIAETRLFRDEGIWFDPKLRYSGGEDTKFLEDVKARGFTVGWVKEAITYETVPVARLSLRYQCRRACDQANNGFHGKIAERPSRRYKIFLRLPAKLLQFLTVLLTLPFRRKSAPLKLARIAGGYWGKVSAALGRRSKHYTTTTGH